MKKGTRLRSLGAGLAIRIVSRIAALGVGRNAADGVGPMQTVGSVEQAGIRDVERSGPWIDYVVISHSPVYDIPGNHGRVSHKGVAEHDVDRATVGQLGFQLLLRNRLREVAVQPKAFGKDGGYLAGLGRLVARVSAGHIVIATRLVISGFYAGQGAFAYWLTVVLRHHGDGRGPAPFIAILRHLRNRQGDAIRIRGEVSAVSAIGSRVSVVAALAQLRILALLDPCVVDARIVREIFVENAVAVIATIRWIGLRAAIVVIGAFRFPGWASRKHQRRKDGQHHECEGACDFHPDLLGERDARITCLEVMVKGPKVSTLQKNRCWRFFCRV